MDMHTTETVPGTVSTARLIERAWLVAAGPLQHGGAEAVTASLARKAAKGGADLIVGVRLLMTAGLRGRRTGLRSGISLVALDKFPYREPGGVCGLRWLASGYGLERHR